VLVALAVGGAARSGFWNDAVRAQQAGVLPDHAARNRDCTSALIEPVWTRAGCTWNTADTGGAGRTDAIGTDTATGDTGGTGDSGAWVYLIGDSHADHFSEALIAATADIGRPLQIATSNGCPYTGLAMRRDGWSQSFTDRCRAMNHDLTEWLERRPAGTVVIANSNGYWQSSDHSFGPSSPDMDTAAGPGTSADTGTAAGPATLVFTADSDTKLELYRTATIELVDRLERAGHRVVLVHTVPFWVADPPWDPRRCSVFEITAGDCIEQASLAATLDQHPAARAALADAALASGALLIEPRDLLCGGSMCATSRDGVALYRDNTHLSTVASALIAPLFTAALTGPGT
jgi:hypothetical protein